MSSGGIWYVLRARQQPLPSPKESQVSNRSNPTVYVVDDEQIIASTLAAILELSGFTPFAFADPREALKASESNEPALLIADVVMPHMTGIELAILIKSKYPRCKILLFSGQTATADLLEAANNQGHSFVLLAKPVHPTDLLATIKRL
jgi:DNA-binding NtrC family response regulator